MGDVVHALPMVSDIARAFPHARIDWVVEEAFADIPRLHPAVTRVIPIALRRWRKAALRAASWRELFAARRTLRETRYHAIIDCQGLAKSALVAAMARGPVSGYAAASAREPVAAFFYRQRFAVDKDQHAVDRCRQIAAAALGYALDTPADFGIAARTAKLQARPPFDETGAVLLLSNASRPGKRWPDAHWARLEQALARRGMISLLAWGSAAEQVDCERRVAMMSTARVLPHGSLAQIAALAARASLVVGLDTGLTHLAAAGGAPVVGIFCDYETTLVGLRGSAQVRSLGGVGAVPSVDEVLVAIDQVLAPPPPAHQP